MNQIGQRMRELRESARLSQMEIAKLCGTNQTTIARMEAGKTAPSVKILVWWADYFNVSMDYLTCRTDQPEGKLYESKPKLDTTSEDMKQFIEMCFDPTSPFNGKLKDTLLKLMEESKQ
ncbi:MAG: helix-turn-helix transcriptional regulator [Clostridiales bacterium]|nr:helix-turn-helix transcriptional regulator [Clostridiales bacterium]